ncbi:MAG: metallophosphoesterase [Pigmentiphaga sp.]|uniref:metallophosphoesterase family protein n=1 Tax=Pigmentiphaga sp. TaxID=1977564 RepID=UPI0029A8DC7E|nr:metallophosphoesterase [Pigmentiphaga sp.]MDX3905872.1 metallophosphoesterase [Pigmentiphaga sp.]
MTAILHVSDTHFGTERPAVVDALVDLARACEPELVLLGGDITQRARPVQFARAQRFVARLPAPVLAVPGNHDIPLFDVFTRLTAPYRRYCEAFGQQREAVYESDTVLAIGVDSTRAYRHKQGEVSRQQVERVAGILARARRGQLRIVLLHHPLVAAEEGDRKNLVRGRKYAMRVWSSMGADLLLGGHIHLPYVAPLPMGAPHTWTVQAGTAVSSRVRSGIPNSVNLLKWLPKEDGMRACIVERWDYGGDAGFVLHTDRSLAIAPRA